VLSFIGVVERICRNLARDDLTGFLLFEASITGKWLAMLREIAPERTVNGFPTNSTDADESAVPARLRTHDNRSVSLAVRRFGRDRSEADMPRASEAGRSDENDPNRS
jgi:hypothetical protein